RPRTATCALSLHDALPISVRRAGRVPDACASGSHLRADLSAAADGAGPAQFGAGVRAGGDAGGGSHPPVLPAGLSRHAGVLVLSDRKSTRLNSSHVKISYA